VAGFEMKVPLNFQAGLKCDAFSEITEAEQPIVVVRVHFTDEPGRAADRIKEFDHWRVVLITIGSVSQEFGNFDGFSSSGPARLRGLIRD
jgi:hypothetical protein